jgi:hypothetical protein
MTPSYQARFSSQGLQGVGGWEPSSLCLDFCVSVKVPKTRTVFIVLIRCLKVTNLWLVWWNWIFKMDGWAIGLKWHQGPFLTLPTQASVFLRPAPPGWKVIWAWLSEPSWKNIHEVTDKLQWTGDSGEIPLATPFYQDSSPDYSGVPI